MSLVAAVDITEADVNGERVESQELWTGLEAKDIQFLTHCQDVESKVRGCWGRGMFAKFLDLRSRCYRPETHRRTLPKAVIEAHVDIFIHYANGIDLDASSDGEDDDASE